MALFPSLPKISNLGDVFRQFPTEAGPLLEYANIVLRGKSELTIGERELLAAYVSGLNACAFCHDSHRVYAKAFGIDERVVGALLDSIDDAPIRNPLKPIFKYVHKLNTLPPRLVDADVKAVLNEGWSETTLFTAVQISGLFNLFNRIVEGAGVNFDYSESPQSHPANVKSPEEMANSYRDFATTLGLR